MSEELTIQGGDSQEDVTIERTIEVSIDKNGLGIESGQVFPSVTVDFAPIIAPASVRWGDIIGKPDPVTNVFYNSREADFEYETFDGQGDVIISRDRLKEILDIPTNAAKVYSYDDNFDEFEAGDIVKDPDGGAWIVREKDDYSLVLCSYDYGTVFFDHFLKNQGEWECVSETETPIRLEDAEVGNLVSIDENGNISDSGSKASDFITQHQDISGKADKVSNATSGNFAGLDGNGNLTDSGKAFTDFVAYIGYNPRESDFIYRKGDENGQDEIIISKENLTKLIVPEISIDIATDALSDEKTASPKAVKSYVDTKVSTAYKAAGSAASVAALGSLDASHEGFVYNMSASFTTTSDFVEGSGVTYPVGTNVVIVNVGTSQSASYKYDVLAGFVDISGKQDVLVSGTNIKTINNESILGSGNITIQGNVQSDWEEDDTTDSSYVENRPAVRAGTGTNSIIEGDLTNNVAFGTNSHAEGLYTQAIGDGSHAEGNGVVAKGEGSHAEGSGESGRSLYVSGEANSRIYTTSSNHNLKVGNVIVYNDIVWRVVVGIENQTTFELDSTLSSTELSNEYVFVFYGVALGACSHIEGSDVIASGMFAHAEGYQTIAGANNSHAEGGETFATNFAEHAQGKYNKSNKASNIFGNAGNTLHSIGIGSSDSNRKNAVEVMQNGDVYVYGVGDYDGTNPSSASTLQSVVSSGGGGTATDVQINGTSITSNDVANIITEGTYNASTNKIATMSDLPSVSGKADKVSGATNGNLAALDSNGNLTDSGYDASDFATAAQGALAATAYQKPSSGIPASDLASGVIPSVPVQDVTVGGTSVVSSGTAVIPAIPDVTGKADKVSSATSGNFAGLDSNGNLTDSGKKASDFLTSSDLSNYVQKSQTAGLVKNDGTIDTTSYGTYSKPSGGIPSSDMTNAVQTSLGKADTAYQLPSGGIPASDLASGVIPTVPTISTDIVADKASTTKTAAPKAVYDEIHPAVVTTQPAGGFAPNVLYNLGTLTGTVTFAMASAVDSSVMNHWYWTFDTDTTAPTVTWPQEITSWNGGSAPTINASKHYEISVLNGIGIAMEV